MVNIKSLRIGSHVAICGGERVKVTSIRSNGIGTTTLGDMDESNLTPIPLTPELLKELGFQFKDNGYDELWWIGGFNLTHGKGSAYWGFCWGIRLEFLHELEALYYMSYGEDLIKG